MGIELYWDNDDQTVMLCEVDRSWTWDEMDAVIDKVKKTTDHSETLIGAILDLRQGVHFPGGSFLTPGALSRARRMLKMGEGERQGPVVVVGASPVIKTIYKTLQKMDKHGLSSVSFAQSLDEARVILQAQHYRYEPTASGETKERSPQTPRSSMG
ncbi:MAG: hypothetical protein ABI835_08905 [Chloroflexota bacterium]